MVASTITRANKAESAGLPYICRTSSGGVIRPNFLPARHILRPTSQKLRAMNPVPNPMMGEKAMPSR